VLATPPTTQDFGRRLLGGDVDKFGHGNFRMK
jgi:hypothetical protein